MNQESDEKNLATINRIIEIAQDPFPSKRVRIFSYASSLEEKLLGDEPSEELQLYNISNIAFLMFMSGKLSGRKYDLFNNCMCRVLAPPKSLWTKILICCRVKTG